MSDNPELVNKLIDIQNQINEQYVRGEDGKLHPTFRVPRRDELAVQDYQVKYDRIAHSPITKQGKSLRGK